MDTSNFFKNPIILLNHGTKYELPVGKAMDKYGNVKVWREENEYLCKIYFAKTPVAKQVFDLVKGGFLNGASIGGRPLELQKLPGNKEKGFESVREIVRSELTEISIVCVPANQDTRMILEQNSINGKSLLPEIKSFLINNNMDYKDCGCRKSEGYASREEFIKICMAGN